VKSRYLVFFVLTVLILIGFVLTIFLRPVKALPIGR